jgi:hypothetical protein
MIVNGCIKESFGKNAMIKRTGVLSIILLLFFPIFSQPGSEGRVKLEEYPLKALIISRFFNFVKWPAASGNTGDSSHFVLGVFGKTPILEHEQTFYEEIELPEKKVTIKKISQLGQINECHALIIAPTESGRLKEILSITGDKPILSIGDTRGFAEEGVLINLYREGKKVKFEINYSAVKKSGLVFSSKLYKLARIINYIR